MQVLSRRWQCEDDVVTEYVRFVAKSFTVPIHSTVSNVWQTALDTWMDSDDYKWLKERSEKDIEVHHFNQDITHSIELVVTAELREQDLTHYLLISKGQT